MSSEQKSAPDDSTQADSLSPESRNATVQAINHIFAEFQLIYNNQYHKAFPTTDKLNYAKKLWFNFLKGFTAEQILRGADQAIKNSEFLPTIKGLLKYISDESGLPSVRAAFNEACLAPSPKKHHQWSHPVVYLAGEETGWYLLSSSVENKTLPIFEKIYTRLSEAFLKGEQLELPAPDTVEPPQEPALPREQQKQKLHDLVKKLNL